MADCESGMFLYAQVVLNSIEYLDDISEVGNELAALPEDLDAAYELTPDLRCGISPLIGTAMRGYFNASIIYGRRLRERRHGNSSGGLLVRLQL